MATITQIPDRLRASLQKTRKPSRDIEIILSKHVDPAHALLVLAFSEMCIDQNVWHALMQLQRYTEQGYYNPHVIDELIAFLTK